jgi:hypothetical protein
MPATPGEKEACGASGNVYIPQVTKLFEASSGSQYTKEVYKVNAVVAVMVLFFSSLNGTRD